MLASIEVPIDRGAAQAEVSAEIDDRDAGGVKRHREFGGHAVGRARKTTSALGGEHGGVRV